MKYSRSFWINCGLGIGILTGLIVSLVQAVFDDWVSLDSQLPFNLVWASAAGYFIGLGTCPVARTKNPVHWHARISIRSMMIAVAAMGTTLGVGIVTHRISRAARLYQQKAITSERKIQYYRSLAFQYEDVEGQAIQKLKRLEAENPTQDQGDSYAARMQRHKTMTQGAQSQRDIGHSLSGWYDAMVKHEAMLADKYRRASRRPWLPVTSDPPEPPQPAEP